ncbi:MAG: GDP-mannose dehydrogenase [Deltaproteobacteria bacterium]|nr:GDP-mannose dehydrogenase [Deltaproteobacteria bacterium]
MEYSTSPDEERFALPTGDDYIKEYERLKELAEARREEGFEIVVVMGLGFVGAVMAGVVADSVDKKTGKSNKFVIGMQRPSPRSFWKIPLFNRGISPVKAEDPEVALLIERCVTGKKTLTATFTYDALKLADVLVLDIQCDYLKEELGNLKKGVAEIAALEESFKIIGTKISPNCMVLIETTVPPGTTEYIAYPLIKKGFKARGIDAEPLLAHSFERVMPGKEYVRSVRDFWRVCSGIDQESRERVTRFLSEVLNVEEFPLTVLDRPIESETCKIVENSYRATILAFLNEWSLFAETNGVDIVKVIDAIKVRPTHSNIMFPGPGIGGYCLPKDGGLGLWAYKHLMGFENDIFKITPEAININDTRALHAAQLVRDALRNMGRIVAASQITLLGASYREDVGDTRYSGSEIIVRKLTEMGAEIKAHDAYVQHWWELEKQESYPAVGASWSRFFRNQEHLSDFSMTSDLEKALEGSDAVIFAVRHKPYLDLDPKEVVRMAGGPLAVVDCFGILDDQKIEEYFELGCEVKGMGRGHINRIKDRVRKRKA